MLQGNKTAKQAILKSGGFAPPETKKAEEKPKKRFKLSALESAFDTDYLDMLSATGQMGEEYKTEYDAKRKSEGQDPLLNYTAKEAEKQTKKKQEELEDYKNTDAYKKNPGVGTSINTFSGAGQVGAYIGQGLLNLFQTGNWKGDEKAGQLRAEGDYLQGIANTAKNESVILKDATDFEKWPEADKKDLLRYLDYTGRGTATGGLPALFSGAVSGLDRLNDKYGRETVRNVMESISRKLNAEDAAAAQKAGQENASLLESLLTVPIAVGGSVTATSDYLGQALKDVTGVSSGRFSGIDPNTPGALPGIYAEAVQQGEAENVKNWAMAAMEAQGFGDKAQKIAGDVAQTVYTAGIGALENMTRVAVTGGVGSLALAGVSSFSSAVREATLKGANPSQAMAMGLISAATEVLTEKLPLDNLLSNLSKAGNAQSVLSIVKESLKQAGIEATTEEINFIAGVAAEAAVLRGKSDYNTTVADLVASGMPYAEAVQKANEQLLYQAGQTAVQSALSGFMTSAGTSAITNSGGNAFANAAGGYLQKGDNGSITEETKNSINTQGNNKNGAEANTTPDDGKLDISEVVDETIAQLNNAPKDPVSAAVESFATTGAVSNKQATDILNSVNAVQQLVRETGVKLDGLTMAQRRNAVKSAIEQMARENVVEESTSVAETTESSGIKKQLRSQQDALNNMQPAVKIQAPAEFSNMDKAGKQNWVVEKLRPTGYKVDRKGFGIIDFAKKRLKEAFKYFDSGSAEEVSFEAIPYVLESGIEISSHEDHKGRNYRTVTIAAPVVVNGKRGNMAVVVKQTDGNHYKVHRILTPDGSVFQLSETTNEADRADGGVTENGSLATSNGAASLETGVLGNSNAGHRQTQTLIPDSNDIISNNLETVNTENGAVGAAEKGFSPKYEQIDKYGAIPEGENPVRVDQLPKSTDGENKVSYTPRTALEAKVTPDEFVPLIENATVRGDFSFIPIKNSESVEKAKAEISKKGWEKAKEDWTADVRSGKASPEITAIGAILYNNAVNSGKRVEALDILRDYTMTVRNSAQALQAARILKTLTPENRLYMIEASVEKLNEELKEKKAKKKRPTEKDNVPVEQWMQKTGEELAKRLKAKVSAKESKVDTVSKTILKDLVKVARETVAGSPSAKANRTDMDLIRDMVMNREHYQEALDAAKETVRKEFGNDPQVMEALEAWMKTSLDPEKLFVKEITGQKDSEIALPQELVEEYLNAETEEERDAVIVKMQKSVAQQLPTTFTEYITALRYVNMLGNLRTQVRNLAGNFTMWVTRKLHNATATGIEALANKLSGGKVKRTRSLTVDPQQKKSAAKDYDNVKDLLIDDGKFKETDIADTFLRGAQEQKRIFKTAPMEGYRKLTNWAMEQGDAIFSREAYARALAGYLKANGITETDFSKIDTATLDEARLFAAKEAQEATFRDTNWLSGWVSKIGRRKDTPLAGKILAEGTAPFRKTPANVLVRAWEYSPLGVTNSIVKSIQAMRKDSDVTGTDVINSWAKTLTGRGLFYLGMMLQGLGYLSTGPDEDEGKEDFENLNGWQNYAITLPDGTNLTIDAFSPTAIPVLMGAEMNKLIQKDGFQLKDLEKALTSITQPMIEMSMLQGISDTLDSIQYSDSNVMQLAINAGVSYLTQGLTNTALGQIERTFEDKRMTTYIDKDSELPNWLQKVMGKASAKTPAWDFQQIPYINAWGEEEENPALGLNAIYQTLSPSYIEKGVSDEITEELNRLNDTVSDRSVYPKRPDTTVKVDGEDYNLSADEYVKLAKLQGQTQKKIVEDIINSKDYALLTDEEKAKAIEFAYEYARGTARGEVVPDHPGIETKWMREWKGDIADGIIRHVASGTTEKYLGISTESAAYVEDILGGLTAETGNEKVRDVQKLEAVITADKLSGKEKDSVLRDIMGDTLEAKYDKALDMGITAEYFVAAYRKQLDTKGEGKKEKVIDYYVKTLGLSRKTAESLYDLYSGAK